MEDIKEFLYYISKISQIYLYSLPIFYVYFKIISDKDNIGSTHPKLERTMLMLLIFTNSIIQSFTMDGDYLYMLLLVWICSTIPFCIALLYFINTTYQQQENLGSKMKRYLGLQTKYFFGLCIASFFAISIMATEIHLVLPDVMMYHISFIDKLAKADNPQSIIISETTEPRYMSDILLEDIKEISNSSSEIHSALPWKVSIKVYNDSETTWILEYVRKDKNWELRGLDSKSSVTHYTAD